MPLKKGDIIDERKRFPDSCGLVVKIMGGGEGFQKIAAQKGLLKCDRIKVASKPVRNIGKHFGSQSTDFAEVIPP